MENKVAVVAHPFWVRPGGSLLLTASVAYSLKMSGWRTAVAAVVYSSHRSIAEWYGIDLTSTPVFSSRIKFNVFNIYRRLFLERYIMVALDRLGASIVFTDEPYYRSLAGRRDVKIVEYIHYPIEAIYLSWNRKRSSDPRRGNSAPSDILEVANRYYSGARRLFLAPYWNLWRRLARGRLRGNPFTSADVVLTNSRWTAEVIREIYGDNPRVLNPPLPPTVLERDRRAPKFGERDDVVLMVGRFTWDKRYDWVVANVLPGLLKEVGNARLVIAGGSGTRASRGYVRYLASLARRLGFTVGLNQCNENARLCLYENLSGRQLVGLIDRAKALLHAKVGEHWGISVAEAMARGLPVVVHKSGGAWSDIVEHGKYGLGYVDAYEAVEALSKLLTHEKLWVRLSRGAHSKAQSLSIDRFRERLLRILDGL